MYKHLDNGISSPQGFTAFATHAGIRKNKEKLDLGAVYCSVECDAYAVYTQNKVFGAPLKVTRDHLVNNKAQAIICNSGNANTCNSNGVEVANIVCEALAKELSINKEDVVIASTGVIGQKLEPLKITDAIKNSKNSFAKENGIDFSTAIMTTDTFNKQIAIEFMIDDKPVIISACAKGSGMIAPNMATLLCFITTDCNIKPELLNFAFKKVINNTLNMISVDGDTSTNDMAVILSSKLANNTFIDSKDSNYKSFENALFYVMKQIAMSLALDGEGATKLIECNVGNAQTEIQAKHIAKSVISSNLVKAALFASDANWGRILCAIGYSDKNVDVSNIDVYFRSEFGTIIVCENSYGVDFDEKEATKILGAKEVAIDINMNKGSAQATAWGCDLTYDYVKINAEYRT